MTTPEITLLGMVVIDVAGFCCADPINGGCGHALTEHVGPGGECRGVFGCSCQAFRRHKPKCVHNSGEAE